MTLPADGTPNTEFYTLAKVLDVNNPCRFLVDAKTVYRDATEAPDRPKMIFLRFEWGYLPPNDFRYKLRIGVGSSIVTFTNYAVIKPHKFHFAFPSLNPCSFIFVC